MVRLAGLSSIGPKMVRNGWPIARDVPPRLRDLIAYVVNSNHTGLIT